MSTPGADSEAGITRLQRHDCAVPPSLRAVWPDAIPEIYIRGRWPVDLPAIAIVGTTAPSPAARSWAFAYGLEAAERGWAVISGLARGVDGAAHEGALSAGGVTVAVVANGLDSVFPRGRQSLVERIVTTGGTIVSISPPGSSATRERLLLRNQLTSGLAGVVVAVQARGRGGALATMRHAIRQGRLIAACVPPEEEAPDAWAGNALLLDAASPWRDAGPGWRPAHPLRPPDGLAELLTAYLASSGVDGSAPLPETRKELQPRLLERRAAYAGDD